MKRKVNNNKQCAASGILLVLGLAAIAPNCAVAATVLSGTIAADQVWSPIGSPYQLQGDVTIATSATVTVAEGTQAIAAPSDQLGSGFSPAKVELVVNGTLAVNSSTSAVTTFSPTASQPKDSWYGIVVSNGGTLQLASGMTVLTGDLRFSPISMLALSGDASLSASGTVLLSGQFAMSSNPSFAAVGTTLKVLDLTNATSVSGSFMGLPEGATLQSGPVTWQASYGGTLNHDFTLQAVSIDVPTPPPPSGGGGGSGCGGGAGTILNGGTIVNTTLSCAGSPYNLNGDLRIATGTTLTVEPGVSVTPASSDGQASGLDLAEVEIAVDGKLSIFSAPGAPSVLGPPTTGVDGWTGVIVSPGGVVELIGQGVLNGDLRLGAGSILSIAFVDTGTYGSLLIEGDVYINGALSLLFDSDYHPEVGDIFDLLTIANAKSVFGAFTDLPEGTVIDFPYFSLQLTYRGGDGNDVQLTVLRTASQVAEPATLALFGLGLAGLGAARRRRTVG